MQEGILHGNRYLVNLIPDIGSVVASGKYPTPILYLRATASAFNSLERYDDTNFAYTILPQSLSACLGSHREDGYHIGNANSKSFPLYSWSNNSNLSFRVPLDFFSLEEIEKVRQGDLKLTIYGDMTLAVMEKTPPYSDFSGRIVGYSHAELAVPFNIPKSIWIEQVLGRIGHRKFYLLEMEVSRSCEIGRALEYLDSMEEALDAREFEKVASCSRELMDFLTLKYIEPNGLGNSERWKRAKKQFNGFASLFLHKEGVGNKSNAPISVRFDDAQYLILLCKIIVRYVQTLGPDQTSK